MCSSTSPPLSAQGLDGLQEGDKVYLRRRPEPRQGIGGESAGEVRAPLSGFARWGIKRGKKMIRSVVALLLVLGTSTSMLAQSDQVHQQLKQLVSAQGNCWLKEIQSKSIAKAGLETAAYAVAARCSDETQRYKVFAARHDIRNPSQFEEYWNQEERNDLQHIKKMLALIRTQ